MNCQPPPKKSISLDEVDISPRIAIYCSDRCSMKANKKVTRRHKQIVDVEIEDDVLRTFILFVQTAQKVLKYADSHLYREASLSVVKLITLRALASNNRAMTPSELAKWTQTERHNITALVNRMGRDGLVIAERNSSDKRVVNITLTDQGREVLSQAMPEARKVVNQVMASITESDAIPLEKMLRVLRKNAHDGLEDVAEIS